MLSTIRNRLILIGVMIVASIIYLIPRDRTIREQNAQGITHDTTERRIPIKYGLDLQGGMHLAVGLDTSLTKVANPADALQRALVVLGKRIDQFGVSEPLIQQVGKDQIVVELPGLTNQERARSVVAA